MDWTVYHTLANMAHAIVSPKSHNVGIAHGSKKKKNGILNVVVAMSRAFFGQRDA